MSDEQTDDSKDISIGEKEIMNLHLSDIFKKKLTGNTLKLRKNEIICKILKKTKSESTKMIKIKLNGSWCKYVIIGENEFKNNDVQDYGTLDENGLFVFSPRKNAEKDDVCKKSPAASREGEEGEKNALVFVDGKSEEGGEEKNEGDTSALVFVDEAN
jgi:hypothetical protein